MESALGSDSSLQEETFESLDYIEKALADTTSCYRVYSSATQFVEVSADSAYEAMARSGVRQPVRIERFSLRQLTILKEGCIKGESIPFEPEKVLLDAPEVEMPAEPEMIEISIPLAPADPGADDLPAEVAVHAAAAPPAEEKALSQDDVEKLISGG